MSELQIGMRVRILHTFFRAEVPETGTIYNYLPSRPCPWHVRPDGWPEHQAGIACRQEELTPLEQEAHHG